MLNYKTMKFDNMKYLLLVVGVLFAFTACEKEQPVAPGTDLFGDLYDLKQVILDSAIASAGRVEPEWGDLGVNPVGNYQGYIGRSLIKFTNFGTVDDFPVDSIVQVDLVLPVYSTSLDCTQTINISAYPFNSDWDEASTAIPWNSYGDTLDTATFPGNVDSTAFDPIRLELPSTIIHEWADTSDAFPENNGLLLQASGTEVLAFLTARFSQNWPHLDVSVQVTADSIQHYFLAPQADYGYLNDDNVNIVSPPLLQKAVGGRLILKWDGLLDSLPQNKSYIHEAEVQIPVDTLNSFADGKSHSLRIGIQSESDSLKVASGETYNFVVGTSDSLISIRSTANSGFLRRYVQRIITSDSVNTPLVLQYYTEGNGVQHLVVNPDRSKLRIVYSEVR